MYKRVSKYVPGCDGTPLAVDLYLPETAEKVPVIFQVTNGPRRSPGEREKPFAQWPGKEWFMESMADSGKAILARFPGRYACINVLRRLSVDCDCAGVKAAEPVCPDLGILASTDILAVDQASIDLVYALPQALKKDLVERIESRAGLRQRLQNRLRGVLGTRQPDYGDRQRARRADRGHLLVRQLLQPHLNRRFFLYMRKATIIAAIIIIIYR